jgi:hypothetical protein
MLTRSMLTGTLMLIRVVLARAVPTSLVAHAMLAGTMLAATMVAARVHADVHAVVLALVHMDVDGVLAGVYADVHGILTGINADVRTRTGVTAGTRARAMFPVNVNVHVPGVVGNLDVDELVDPVAFGHGFLR